MWQDALGKWAKQFITVGVLVSCLLGVVARTGAQTTDEATPLATLQTLPEAVLTSAEEQQLRQLHLDFWQAYAQREAAAVKPFWSPTAASRVPLERLLQSFARVGKIELQFVRVFHLKVEGERATLRSFTATQEYDAATGKLLPGRGRYWRSFQYVKEAGAWKIADWPLAMQEFAQALLAAPEAAAREALWQAHPDLHFIELNWAMGSIGYTAQMRGDYATAQRAHEISYWLGTEKLNNKLALAIALNNLGAIFLDQADYARALEHSLRGLALLRELSPERSREGLTHLTNNIGEIYKRQGDWAQAQKFLLESLQLAEQFNFRPLLCERLINLASLYQEQGQMAEARAALERSRALATELNVPRLLAETLLALAHLQLLQGQPQLAAETVQQLLPAVATHKIRLTAAHLLLSQARLALGEAEPALAAATQALALAQETSNREAWWEAYAVQGQALQLLGRPAEAETALLAAIGLIEEMRASIVGAETAQQSYFARRLAPYRALVELLLKREQVTQALEYAERGKARALLDVLQQGRTNLTSVLTSSEAAQDRALVTRLAELNAQLLREYNERQPNPARLRELRENIERQRLAHQDFQMRLYVAHPELKTQHGVTTAFQAAALKSGELLTPTNALLEYVSGPSGVQLIVATLEGAQPVVKAYAVATPSSSLREAVNGYRALLASRALHFKPAAQALFKHLLAPALAQLQGKTRLVIVPDDFLWELPFQALLDEQSRYVAERWAVSYAPSLGALSEMQRLERQRQGQAAEPTLLALGNPSVAASTSTIASLRGGGESYQFAPLPQAETEVKAIARLYSTRSRVYLGEAAREGLFKAQAGQFDVLHLAAHGVLNNQQPLYSFLALAGQAAAEPKNEAPARNKAAKPIGTPEDGLLEAWELLRLPLKPRLVVLSACETARGQVRPGEGVIGLSWAFFVAGTPTAIVSQWQVDATSTTDLMIEFHRQWRGGNGTARSTPAAANALQQAALKLLRGQFRHPFYWAGFIVIGAGD